MNKLIALNWKDTFQIPPEKGGGSWKLNMGGFEMGASKLAEIDDLLDTLSDITALYPEYDCVLFPGDEIAENIEETSLALGTQDLNEYTLLPYCLIGHISRRKEGETDEDIREKLFRLSLTDCTPILCVWPIKPTDSLETVIKKELLVLDVWPINKEIIIAYEPGFAVGTGQTMTLDDIGIMYEILTKTLEKYTKRIIYGWSVTGDTIRSIVEITDGVIVGKASQEKTSLLSLFISLGES